MVFMLSFIGFFLPLFGHDSKVGFSGLDGAEKGGYSNTSDNNYGTGTGTHILTK